MFLPPLLGGTVIFQEELKPSEIVSTIRRERVSVLVSVPRVLQSLKQKIERDLEDGGKIEDFRRRFQAAEGKHFLRRWWIFRGDSPAVWVEILGVYFWRRGARCRDGRILGAAGIRGDSGIRADGDYFADQREPSVQVGERVDWESAAGAGSEAGGGWRDFDSRRRSGGGVLGQGSDRGGRLARLQIKTGGTAPEMWARSMRRGIFISRGARRM